MPENKILLVDDEEVILSTIVDILRSWSVKNDIEILTAQSGEKALELLEREHTNIGLIVSDSRMPGMKGSDFLLEVKKRHPDIISILLTGYSDTEDIMKAIKAGIFSYILKPWDNYYLITEIEKALEVYRIRNENKKYMQMIKEQLLWAGELQKNLLKIELPHSEKVVFSVTYRPLPQINRGGDYYDIINLGDEKYFTLIGDVSGHGIKAAFITSILKSIIYSEYVKKHRESGITPSHFLTCLNEKVCHELKRFPDILISFSAGILDLVKYNFTFSNAGHMPIYIIRNRSSCEKLHVEGTALGFSEEVIYNDRSVDIEPNNRIILYTDGLVEIEGKGRKLLEEKKIEEIFLQSNRKQEFNDEVLKNMRGIMNSGDFADDVTLVSAHIKNKQEKI